MLFLFWDSEGLNSFVLQWICLYFSSKCSIGMCSIHAIGETRFWNDPSPPESLNFEKIEKKKSSETLEKHVDLLISQKVRQKPITFFKCTGKISFIVRNFGITAMWFLGDKICFKKGENFPIFQFSTTLQTAKLWAMAIIFIYLLYLSELYSGGVVSQ